MVDFSELLARPSDSFKEPVPLPAGTFHGRIQPNSAGKAYEYGSSSQKKTPYVRYHLLVTALGEDITPEAMEGVELGRRFLRVDFYLTEDSTFRLVNFLHSLGIETDGRPLGECIPEAVGHDILMSVIQRPNQQDPTKVYNEVRDCRALPN